MNSETRPYDTSLREQRQAETRMSIVEAAFDRLLDVEPRELRYADLAKDAGVSVRTVYRHFPQMDDLLAAVADHFTAELFKGSDARADFTGLFETMAVVGRYLDEHPRAFKLFFRTPAFSRSGGVDMMAALFAPQLEGLDDESRRAASAVLDLLCSPYAWDVMHNNWGLRTEQSFGALRLAVEAFIAAAKEHPERLSQSSEDP
jgi:AcrR family transcriptional regulator